MSFAVVAFPEDDSVEVVPAIWICGDACSWPPYRGVRLTSAVKKCGSPDESWQKYAVRVIGMYG
jgi:hypothetical protein